MKKNMMIIAVALFFGAAGMSEANAQTIGQNAKALGSQVVDSIKTKTPVLIDSVVAKTSVLVDSVKSKTPVVIDSIKAKGSRAGDKAAVVADSIFTRGKRWIDRRNERRQQHN